MNLSSHSKKKTQTPLRARLRRAVAEEILAAAEKLMAQHGVHGAGVAEIAARAGVSVGTLYNHFADRKALVVALYRTRRERLGPRLVELVAAHPFDGFEPRLRRFLHDVLALFDEHRDFVKVMTEAEHIKHEGSAGASVLGHLLEGLTQMFAAGRGEGLVAGDVDLDLAARVAAGGLRAVVLRGLAEGRSFAPDAGELADLVLRGALRRS